MPLQQSWLNFWARRRRHRSSSSLPSQPWCRKAKLGPSDLPAYGQLKVDICRGWKERTCRQCSWQVSALAGGVRSREPTLSPGCSNLTSAECWVQRRRAAQRSAAYLVASRLLLQVRWCKCAQDHQLGHSASGRDSTCLGAALFASVTHFCHCGGRELLCQGRCGQHFRPGSGKAASTEGAPPSCSSTLLPNRAGGRTLLFYLSLRGGLPRTDSCCH